MSAFGGLLVGTVIKYADAVMKDVALGSSIVQLPGVHRALRLRAERGVRGGHRGRDPPVFLYGPAARLLRGADAARVHEGGPGISFGGVRLCYMAPSHRVGARGARLRLFCCP